MLQDGVPVEWFAVEWPPNGIPHLKVARGLPRWQSFWELLTLVLALCAWANDQEVIAALGDNKASLQDATAFGGKRQMAAVTRELAWRQARFGWLFACGHLPTEANKPADALSRLAAPEPAVIPAMLARASRRTVPALSKFWRVPHL